MNSSMDDVSLLEPPVLAFRPHSCRTETCFPPFTVQDLRSQPAKRNVTLYHKLRPLPVPVFDVRVLLFEDHSIALLSGTGLSRRPTRSSLLFGCRVDGELASR